MSERPRNGIFEASARRKSRYRSTKLKGKMQNIIVVKPPNPMFRQAVFFLRDDYFLSSDISRQELLEQAKAAASAYVENTVPETESRGFLIIGLCTVILLIGGIFFILYII